MNVTSVAIKSTSIATPTPSSIENIWNKAIEHPKNNPANATGKPQQALAFLVKYKIHPGKIKAVKAIFQLNLQQHDVATPIAKTIHRIIWSLYFLKKFP